MWFRADGMRAALTTVLQILQLKIIRLIQFDPTPYEWLRFNRTNTTVRPYMELMKWALTTLLLLAPTTVLGQSSQALSPEYVMANLKKGVTGRADVLRLFGEPAQRNVRVSSESGSIETFVYTNGPVVQETQKKRKGGGFGAFLRTARGVAGDVAAATGRNYYGSDTADALRRAEHLANAADRASASVDNSDGSGTRANAGPTLTLTIELKNGVVTSYEMGG